MRFGGDRENEQDDIDSVLLELLVNFDGWVVFACQVFFTMIKRPGSLGSRLILNECTVSWFQEGI
jgi:hypothetical protein